MPYRRVVESVGDTGAWAPIYCIFGAPAAPARYLVAIFFGSQTSAFFFTTAPQSLQR